MAFRTILPSIDRTLGALVSNLAALWLCSCAPAQQPAQAPPPQPEPAATPVGEAVTEAYPTNPAAAADQTSQTAETPASDIEEAERERGRDVPEPRKVLYRVAPEGLIVEVEGVRFEPRAEPVKMKGGAWGVKLVVKASAKDDGMHNLLSPKLGPLSIAGHIETKGQETIQFSDRRDGDDEVFITPGQPLEFERTFPSGTVTEAGQPMRPVYWREKLVIAVGLWGLGADGERRRPLKRLFVVRMLGGAKPQAVVSAPEL